jgi:hypothetical protein
VSALAAGAALLALSVSPLRVIAAPGDHVTLSLRNTGAEALTVMATPASYRLDLRGRPLLGRARRSLLTPSRRQVVLAAGTSALLAVRAAQVSNGRRDEAQVLLLTATVRGGAIRVAARVGVVVVIRRAGRVVHHLVPGPLRLRGRMLRLLVANRGSVEEWVGPRRLWLSLRGRAGRATVRARPQRILPGAAGLFEWRLPARLAGAVQVRAVVEGLVVRRYRLRL